MKGCRRSVCSTPVVGSDCGGIPEIILDGITGRIFPMNNSEALAARIAEVIEEPEKTRRMCQAGRELVENQHSLDPMLDGLSEIYARYIDLTAG